jgi:hypothetical protein
MLVKTHDRWVAVHALINTLLKDKSLYCNNCGMDYDERFHPCCEEPHVGHHAQFLKLVIEQNKVIRQTRKNAYASNDDKSMRMKFSLPPRFFEELCKAFQQTYNEPLFRTEKDHNDFTRKFPQFAVCERI